MTSMLASVAKLWLAGRPDQVILIYVLPGSHRVPQLVVPQGHPGPSIRQALGTMILATFAPTMWREYSDFHPSLSNSGGWWSIRKPAPEPVEGWFSDRHPTEARGLGLAAAAGGRIT